MQCLFARRSLAKPDSEKTNCLYPLLQKSFWWIFIYLLATGETSRTQNHTLAPAWQFCIFQMSHRFQMRPLALFKSNISNSFMEYLHHHALSIFPLLFPNRNINQEVGFKIWNKIWNNPLKVHIVFHSNISFLRDGLNGLRIYFFIWNLCPWYTAMPLIK